MARELLSPDAIATSGRLLPLSVSGLNQKARIMASPDKPVSPKPYSASQAGPKDSVDQNAPKSQRVPAKEGSTTPDQERGERIETGKIIARGGKSTGNVPGATEQKK